MIRSFRVGILKNEYGLDDREVIKILGWSDGRSFKNYDSYLLDSRVVDKMLKAANI
jgi:hypothetical protein